MFRDILLLPHLNNIFLYSESNTIICLGGLNTRKMYIFPIIRIDYYFNLLICCNSIFVPYYLMNKKYVLKKRNNRIDYHKWILFFNNTLYSNKSRIKMVGRGFKITQLFIGGLIIRLGYSHLIFYTLDMFMRLRPKPRKIKFHTFYASNHTELRALITRFHLMRIPDIYSGKGVFTRKMIL